MVSVADHVIKKCGGAKFVAEWLGLHISSVYRFTYDREHGGSNGLIPSEHQTPLILKARENGIELAPVDFFPAEADGAAFPAKAPE